MWKRREGNGREELKGAGEWMKDINLGKMNGRKGKESTIIINNG